MNDASHGSGARPLSMGVSLLLCAVVAGVVCWWRLFLYRNASVGVGYSLPILLVGWTRRRNLLWGMCIVFAAMAWVKFWLNHNVTTMPLDMQLFSMLMLLVDLVVLTGIIDLVLRREASLSVRTEELYRRQQELKMSNEGMAERQQTMEVLLKLSRSLTVGQSRAEILAEIARTIRLLLGETTAAALWDRRDQTVEMIGHEGFGKLGPETVTAPLGGSFAGLVIQRQKCVAVSNLAQHAEIKPEKSREGPTYQALLGAPVKSGAEIVGALVVYSPQPRSWTESDFSLVESLAAQAAVSIAAVQLREQTENEHRELQTIVDAVPFGILRTDAAASRLICNPAAAAMLGFPETIEGDQNQWPQMKLTGPKGEIPLARSPLLRALRGEVTAAMEMELTLADGDTMTILCNAAPIRDRSGAISGAISAFVDTSIVKSIREELFSNRKQAEEVSSLRGRFLSAVSHDIRTPANAIGLLTELLRKTIGDPAQADDVPEICREIDQSAASLVNLVTDVIDLIRLDIGRLDVSETEIELGTWLAEQTKGQEAQAKKKNIQFVLDVPDPELRLRTDKVKLSRVLGNLLGNAVKFTESGEVRLETSLLDDHSLRFDVIDTGIGIPQENMANIFDEYAQIKNPRRAKSGGTGLGLSITRRLVELLGGKLDVASEPGKGSSFSFVLPSSKVIR